MILRGNRQFSLGALQRSTKRLNYDVENEPNAQIKNELNECLLSLRSEIETRLNKKAWFFRNEKSEVLTA